MNRALLVVLLLPFAAIASGPFTSLHPEEHIPDATEQPSADPFTGFVTDVQKRLHSLGFDAGTVNGDFGTKTQAALAQFQLSRAIPASGQLDDQTLAELGVQRPQENAAAGNSNTVAENAPVTPPAARE